MTPSETNIVIEWLPQSVARWKPQLEQYAGLYRVDPNLPAIIMTLESGGDPRANSGVAKGLMQISEPRGADIAAKFLQQPVATYDVYDPTTSIEFGIANIKHLIELFGPADQGSSWDETVALVAAGYVGGEGAAHTLQQQGLSGVSGPVTHDYIHYVSGMWRERHDNKSATYRYWYEEANGQALIRAAERYHFPIHPTTSQ